MCISYVSLVRNRSQQKLITGLSDRHTYDVIHEERFKPFDSSRNVSLRRQTHSRPLTMSLSTHNSSPFRSLHITGTKNDSQGLTPFYRLFYRLFPLLCPIILVILILLLWITPFTQTSQPPSLGTLYNCDTTQYQGVYSLPPSLYCANPSDKADISASYASVLQYHPQTTAIELYHDVAKLMELTCKESFSGAKGKHTHISTMQGHNISCPPRIKPTFISDSKGISPTNTFATIPPQTISAVAKGGRTVLRSLGQGIHDKLNGVNDLVQRSLGGIENTTSTNSVKMIILFSSIYHIG